MQMLGSWRRPAWLLLALAVLVGVAVPTVATDAPTSVTLTTSNSSSLSFSVGIPSNSDAEKLHVVLQPSLDGDATDLYFTLVQPIETTIAVDITGLTADSGYVCTFYLESTSNGTSTGVHTDPSVISTHSLGPAIISLFAADPSASGDASDSDFSDGDTITIAFDSDTNQPSVGSKDAIDALFSFSLTIGAAYTGTWVTAKELVITVSDIGQSHPLLGEMYATVIGDIYQPDGLSDKSVSVSPPLIGSWESTTASTQYLVPIDSTGAAISNPDYNSYLATCSENVACRLPLTLSFSSTDKTKGYGINAVVTYPNTINSMLFTLIGDNFTASSVSREAGANGAVSVFTTAQLTTAFNTLKLAPEPDFVGFACVHVTLMDRASNAEMASSYVNIQFQAPTAVSIPTLSVNGESDDLMSDPIGTMKTYKTPLIIALCSVVGFFILLGLGICVYKKYRGGRDARDFEGQSLTAEPASERLGSGDGGATRRFYYDAKV